MKKTVLFYAFTFLYFTVNIYSLPLIGLYNVGTGQTYTSLTNPGGFFAAVNAQGLSGNVTVNITSDLISETGANSLNQWAETGLGGYTITIKSSAAVLRTISGSPALPLISLDGADRVTFDGRFAGSGQYLKFRNTNGSNPVFKFVNDAQSNTITFCIIESNNTTTSSGTILFSSTTGTNGNDNNTISSCDIRDRSDAAGTPVNAIYSSGNSSSVAKYNSNNTISNNNIYNFYNSGSNSAGIYLGDGNTDWTISGNSFYQTSARAPGSASGWNIILIGSSSNNNVTILNNYFGGSTSGCGGTAWTVSGGVANFIYAIRFSAAGSATASNVNGNTISNFDLTATPSVNNGLQFSGMLINAGLVNIGTISGNNIGDNTTTGNIKVTLNGTQTNTIVRGIDQRSSGSVNNNHIGSITLAGGITGIVNLDAISYQSTPSSAVSISNNMIGSSSIANSIQSTASGIDLVMNGINANTFTSALTVSGNTIANMNNISTGVDASVRGIIQNRAATSPMTIQNNSIFELSTASNNTGTKPSTCAAIGIMDGSNDSTSQLISGNVIHGIRCTGNNDVYVVGISHTEQISKGTLQKNKLYDLTNSSSTSGPAIYGIDAYWGNWSFCNNSVCITNGAASDKPIIVIPHKLKTLPIKVEYSVKNNTVNGLSSITENDFNILQNPDRFGKPEIPGQKDVFTNGILIQGIHDEAEIGCIYYYNSVYVGGNVTSGTANSYCYARPVTAWPTPVTMYNNLFFNARTGGSGINFAVGNEISPPGKNWRPGNYNVFISPSANSVTSWGSGTSISISQWRDSSSGDKQTWNTTSAGIIATNLFNSISTGDLSINSGNSAAWIVSGKGLALSSINSDISGNSRSTTVAGGTTDIGAYEFAPTPPSNQVAVADSLPKSGGTSTYTLWGRTIAKIQWGSGGTSYPTAINIKYYTGVPHPNAATGKFGISYWDVSAIGSLTGATYDITWYFGDNETYTITSPSANTRIAKYVSTWEVYSVAGTGIYQTELTWSGLTAKTRGLSNFSSFTLTDSDNPLPVSILYVNAVSSARNITLSWATAWEINNRGFDIERRMQPSRNSSYTDWAKIGFVQGNGTTQEQKYYNYADDKLPTGRYQYRLKQYDFNGNFEYFNLNNPGVIEIGKPSAFDLHQNYPNPSNPKTKIDFEIPFSAKVIVKVYDFLGKEVTTLVNENRDAGYYTTSFDGSNLASGVYFYRIFVEGSGQSFNKTMKLILVK